MRSLLICLCTLWLLPSATSATASEGLNATLDAFHAAAARANTQTYLGLLTDDAVFLGTDGSERWQGEEFRIFVREQFDGGVGWTYTPVEREIRLADTGEIAWFDELLDNDTLGRCRGSGVLVREGEAWRIAQYNLSVPIPNHMVLSVVAGIRSVDGAATNGSDAAPAVETVLEEGAGTSTTLEDSEGGEQKRCRKRFKTNARAGC